MSAQFWERFAQDDPCTYILPSLKEQDPQKFWPSGEATVTQHVRDLSMIEGYLHVIGILLEENGTAYLQFDTRQRDYSDHVKSTLPDFLLPRFWQRGIRRIRRSADEIESALRRAGLKIIGEWAPRTSYHRSLIKRMQSPLAAK